MKIYYSGKAKFCGVYVDFEDAAFIVEGKYIPDIFGGEGTVEISGIYAPNMMELNPYSIPRDMIEAAEEAIMKDWENG